MSKEIAWRPEILNVKNETDKIRLEKIKAKNRVWATYDTIDSQLRDLVCSRNPGWTKKGVNEKALDEKLRELAQGDTASYGIWAYFPWSGVLTHILPEDEFHELRLNRNHNKITRAEQELLSHTTVGVVGLSVGNAVAISLALEGVGGCLKLADFDHLDLSNMNRIRASVSDIGVPKTVLCARQIYELNPFAKLEMFEDGISEKNIHEFLVGQNPLDVLIDECDDIRLKFLIREQARKHRIPVLMETSDRGMLDIERFDREPKRPMFHGVLGDISFSDIPKNLTTEEKVPYVAPIIGIDTLSDRLAASMLEIGERISTWPQLGSDVLLGGASVCIATRKILLGRRLTSGRYFIDVDSHLRKTPDLALHSSKKDDASDTLDLKDELRKGEPAQTADFMKFLVAQGMLAPSGGNSQPWKFYIEEDCISVLHDRKRSKNIIDPDSCGAYIGLGAAIENIRIAAEANGCHVEINYLPSPIEHLMQLVDTVGEIVATIRVKLGRSENYVQSLQLYPYISRRMTDRKTYGCIPLTHEQLCQLHSTASTHNLSLKILQSEDDLGKIAEIIGAGDRLRFLCKKSHEELMSEIRWTDKEAASTGDGIDIQSLCLTPAQMTGLQLIRRPKVAELLRQQSGGSGLTELSEKSVKHSSAVGLISVAVTQNLSFLTAGQAIQLFWLKCTQLGLSLHPNTGLIYMFNSLNFKGILTNNELDELNTLKTKFFQVFDGHEGLQAILLFRLSVGEPLQTTALRKRLSDVLLSEKT